MRTFFLLSALATLAIISFAYGTGGGGGSGEKSVAVHPRIHAAIGAYDRCLDSGGDPDLECIEVVALNYTFYDTIADEMGIRLKFGDETIGPQFASWAADELAGVYTVDEVEPTMVVGRLHERQLGILKQAILDLPWTPMLTMLEPGGIPVLIVDRTVVTETWLLHKGFEESAVKNDCVDERVHHAYFSRDAEIPYDGSGNWPPVQGTINPVDVDPNQLVLTRNLFRDEHFCFHNSVPNPHPDALCDAVVGLAASVPAGLPALWEGTVLSLENEIFLAGDLDEDVLEDVETALEDYPGYEFTHYYIEGAANVIGDRDDTTVRFRDTGVNTSCVEMELEIPLYSSGSGESIAVSLSYTAQLNDLFMTFPAFRGTATAQFFVCWDGSPDAYAPPIDEAISVSVGEVTVVGEEIHPGDPITTIGGGGAPELADIAAAIEDSLLNDPDYDPAPFFSSALAVPLRDLMVEWTDHFGAFLALYAERVNNRVGADVDTGYETVTALSGVSPLGWPDSDCKYLGGGGADYAGLSIVIGDANDHSWAIGEVVSALEGRNLSSFDNPARWVRVDVDGLAGLERTGWLQDYDAGQTITGNNQTVLHPLQMSMLTELLEESFYGYVNSGLTTYSGEFCEDRWDAIESPLLEDCRDAILNHPQRDELCGYYINEAALAFYDSCEQPGAMEIAGGRCAGLQSIEVSNVGFSTSSRVWRRMSWDYYETYAEHTTSCLCAELENMNSGDFSVWDIDYLGAPDPYIDTRNGQNDHDTLHIPSWISLNADLDSAVLKVKVEQGCPEYEAPNEGLYAAKEARLVDVEYLLATYHPPDDQPRSLTREQEALQEWLDENTLVTTASISSLRDEEVDILDGAAYTVTMSGELEMLLGFDWAMPLFVDRNWERVAQRWANNTIPYPDQIADVWDLIDEADHLTETELNITVDGACLYLDPSDVDVDGTDPTVRGYIEDYVENWALDPCGLGTAFLGGDALEDSVEQEMQVPFVGNVYWDGAESLLLNDAGSRELVVNHSYGDLYMNDGAGLFVMPPGLAAMTYPTYAPTTWSSDYFYLFDPLELAVDPRMLVVDELFREGFEYYHDGWNDYEWTMNELLVVADSYATRNIWDSDDWPNDDYPYEYWTGPDYWTASGRVSWYAFDPNFSTYPNESLDTLDGVPQDDADNWAAYAGTMLYDRVEESFFGFNSNWSPHDAPIDATECQPEWEPGQP